MRRVLRFFGVDSVSAKIAAGVLFCIGVIVIGLGVVVALGVQPLGFGIIAAGVIICILAIL